MSYTLIIRPEAETDLAGQFYWYEQRKKGLGYEFLAEMRSSFRQIEEAPLQANLKKCLTSGLKVEHVEPRFTMTAPITVPK